MATTNTRKKVQAKKKAGKSKKRIAKKKTSNKQEPAADIEPHPKKNPAPPASDKAGTLKKATNMKNPIGGGTRPQRSINSHHQAIPGRRPRRHRGLDASGNLVGAAAIAHQRKLQKMEEAHQQKQQGVETSAKGRGGKAEAKPIGRGARRTQRAKNPPENIQGQLQPQQEEPSVIQTMEQAETALEEQPSGGQEGTNLGASGPNSATLGGDQQQQINI